MVGLTEEILTIDSRSQMSADLPLREISISRREKFEN
jgi:hypothetical protein